MFTFPQNLQLHRQMLFSSWHKLGPEMEQLMWHVVELGNSQTTSRLFSLAETPAHSKIAGVRQRRTQTAPLWSFQLQDSDITAWDTAEHCHRCGLTIKLANER